MRAIPAIALAFVLTACGGTTMGEEVSPESTEQSSSQLAGSCEALVGTFCRPGAFTSCTWADGNLGECECQRPPYNKWLCY
ncbi:hypothetical protein POL68_39685 [Stigmatella sp. ncwal1]|uniref:Lipoprotein n=1 Tax=Stigmatella ashevillensis TaxID=2995309 RepID=A0ABT5DM09_9BACT|nr:hypothetical protein [Stigmatella ashevillena]MDC0714638.1 hypothetical protein [Stigmatella ashevillena]